MFYIILSSVMGFDALKYVEELKEAGCPENQAQTHVRIWNRIVDSDLATKRDIEELKRDIEELKRDIKGLKRDIEGLKRDMKEIEFKIKELESKLTIKLGIMLAVGITLLAVLIKF